MLGITGIWSKRIRTFACRYQKPKPFHLAILQKIHLRPLFVKPTKCYAPETKTKSLPTAPIAHNETSWGRVIWLCSPTLLFRNRIIHLYRG